MSIRSLRLRPSLAAFPGTAQCVRLLQHRGYTAQSTAPEQDLAAQAELAAKAKVLSPYHKVSFDERKVRIPWQDGKTSSLYISKLCFSHSSYACPQLLIRQSSHLPARPLSMFRMFPRSDQAEVIEYVRGTRS
jgi:hypothetical protein